MKMSNAKLVCSQDRRPKAMAISTPIPIRCFIGTLRTRRILRLWRAKRNMSGLATYRDLSQPLDTDSVKGVRLKLLGLLWAHVPLEGNRGAHLSFRLQRQTVVRGTRNDHVLILNNLKFIAAAHRKGLAAVLAPHVRWHNLFQNLRDRF